MYPVSSYTEKSGRYFNMKLLRNVTVSPANMKVAMANKTVSSHDWLLILACCVAMLNIKNSVLGEERKIQLRWK